MSSFLRIQYCILVCLSLMVKVRARSTNVVSMNQDEVNNRPIIGILTEPTFSKEYGDEFIEATYVQFLESAGARVIPIRGNQSPEFYNKLFKNINGVLFPGGGANITQGPYYDSGKMMYDLALEANDNGDYFPIWATCLGLELLTVLTSGRYLLQHTDSSNLTLPLTLAKGYQDSRLFKYMPPDIVDFLSKEPVTQNNHQWSLLVKDFETNTDMKEFYHLLSTNHGRDESEFVSMMEAKKYPIYAAQWHPEKNVFLWNSKSAINHEFHAIKVTQYMANFFVNEARKSRHHYDSTDQEAKALIENARRIFVPDYKFLTCYFFNYTTSFE